jgi:hypothetical protein
MAAVSACRAHGSASDTGRRPTEQLRAKVPAPKGLISQRRSRRVKRSDSLLAVNFHMRQRSAAGKTSVDLMSPSNARASGGQSGNPLLRGSEPKDIADQREAPFHKS